MIDWNVNRLVDEDGPSIQQENRSKPNSLLKRERAVGGTVMKVRQQKPPSTCVFLYVVYNLQLSVNGMHVL